MPSLKEITLCNELVAEKLVNHVLRFKENFNIIQKDLPINLFAFEKVDK